MAWLFLIFSIVCFILFLISFRYIPQYTHLISAIGTLLIAIFFFTRERKTNGRLHKRIRVRLY